MRLSLSTSWCGVQAGALRRAARLDQATGLVHAKRLRMHVRQFGCDRDHEHPAVGRDPDAGHPTGAPCAQTGRRRRDARVRPSALTALRRGALGGGALRGALGSGALGGARGGGACAVGKQRGTRIAVHDL